MAFFLPVFQSLNEAGIRYITVGGVATILHGYSRTTGDIDLIIDLTPSETLKTIECLELLGYRPKLPVSARGFTNSETREGWIRDKGMMVFTMYEPSQPGHSIDLFVRQPISFNELWEKSEVFDISGTQIRVCSLADLITMKRIAGRSIDQVDIEKLIEVNNRGK